MDKLTQEGGMADDGMSQEPTTGNDIPPGALASEVRDDVDAKLSEGEYVVPADVVRYFGVSFFEDLRTKAKEGLTEMESEGRIGGTPVDSQGVPVEDGMDELSPEEEQMLQQALGGSRTTGMAEGGDVGGFDRTQFKLTPTNLNDIGLGTESAMETRQYYNPTTGEKRALQFMDGVPLGAVPEGFVPWSQTLEDTYNAGKKGTKNSPSDNSSSSTDITPSNGDNSKGTGLNYSKWAEDNYDAITSNPYQFGLDALEDKSGNFLGKALGVAGLATGLLPLAAAGAGLNAANKMQNVAEANAALLRMESDGLAGSAQYEDLSKKVKAYVADLPVAQQAALAGQVAGTGKNYMSAIDAVGGTKVNTPVAPTTASTRTNTGGTTASTTATRVSVPNTTPSTLAPATSPKPVPRPSSSSSSTPVVNTVRPTVTTTPTKTTTPTTKVVSTPSGNQVVTVKPKVTPGSERFAEGGLVTKPKKTNPKATGLGGKQ